MQKTPQFFTTALIRSVNFGARQFGAFPPHPNDHYPVPTGLTTGPLPGIAKQIISTIKTIRKKN
jgi:hypothetical protein